MVQLWAPSLLCVSYDAEGVSYRSYRFMRATPISQCGVSLCGSSIKLLAVSQPKFACKVLMDWGSAELGKASYQLACVCLGAGGLCQRAAEAAP